MRTLSPVSPGLVRASAEDAEKDLPKSSELHIVFVSFFWKEADMPKGKKKGFVDLGSDSGCVNCADPLGLGVVRVPPPCPPGMIEVPGAAVSPARIRSYRGTPVDVARAGYMRSEYCRSYPATYAGTPLKSGKKKAGGRKLAEAFEGLAADLVEMGSVAPTAPGVCPSGYIYMPARTVSTYAGTRLPSPVHIPALCREFPKTYAGVPLAGIDQFAPGYEQVVGLGQEAIAIGAAKEIFSATGLKRIGGATIGIAVGDLIASAMTKFIKLAPPMSTYLGGVIGAIAGYELGNRVLKSYEMAEGASIGALVPALQGLIRPILSPIKKAIKLEGYSAMSALEQVRLPEAVEVGQVRLPEEVTVMGQYGKEEEEEVLTEEELGQEEEEGMM